MLTDYSKSIHSTESGRVSYKFSFPVTNDSDLRVMVVDPADLEQVPLFLGYDYLVAGVGDADGGSVELTASGMKKAAAGLKISVKLGQAHEYQMLPMPGDAIGADLSEDEVAVGIDYTDGNRVIYQKTIALGAIPNGSSSNPAQSFTYHNIVAMRRYWIERGWTTGSAGDSVCLPSAHGEPYASISIWMDPEKIGIRSWGSFIAYQDSRCTIRYTKE